MNWPEYRRTVRFHTATGKVGDIGATIEGMFTLNWYYNKYHLSDCHNLPVTSTQQQGATASPAYHCSICNSVMLVPFPEVETDTELCYWFNRHMEGH